MSTSVVVMLRCAVRRLAEILPGIRRVAFCKQCGATAKVASGALHRRGIGLAAAGAGTGA